MIVPVDQVPAPYLMEPIWRLALGETAIVFLPSLNVKAVNMSSEKSIRMVDFEGDHPQDWLQSRKWLIMITVAIPLFLMPLSSTITTPAEEAIATEFNVTSVTGPLALSLFLLMYCLGPILLGPLSELYGRLPVLQAGNLFYFAFNLAAGFSRSMPQLLLFRLLSGMGASASLAVGAFLMKQKYQS